MDIPSPSTSTTSLVKQMDIMFYSEFAVSIIFLKLYLNLLDLSSSIDKEKEAIFPVSFS